MAASPRDSIINIKIISRTGGAHRFHLGLENTPTQLYIITKWPKQKILDSIAFYCSVLQNLFGKMYLNEKMTARFAFTQYLKTFFSWNWKLCELLQLFLLVITALLLIRDLVSTTRQSHFQLISTGGSSGNNLFYAASDRRREKNLFGSRKNKTK